jgi:hypothetical protein
MTATFIHSHHRGRAAGVVEGSLGGLISVFPGLVAAWKAGGLFEAG